MTSWRPRSTLARFMANIALAAGIFAAARQDLVWGVVAMAYALWFSLLLYLIRSRSQDGRIF